ncbi:hypothetical protein HHK36_019548 [Tetracentron sinense]|uniref:Protein kinase domain-containing protein n=1 Tax=Tetracentron sinense TaxID=13715 RepID=A0A835D990_TETSI|nr:hypothetical protein HHK36_019548 [Tetracentron sinense]
MAGGYNQAADVWSAGDHISTSAKDLITGMLCKDPSQRPTAAQVLGFSFRSCCESIALEFSSPVPSMPSFAFFSPSSAVEQHNLLGFTANISRVDAIYIESSLEKLFMLPDSPLCYWREAGEMERKAIEVRRGGTTRSRMLGIHNKRKHTIGLGELEQLDLIVTESVIQWASCTDLLSAPSLRSSLVC